MTISTAYSDIVHREFEDENPAGLSFRRGQFHDVIVGDDRVISIARTDVASRRLPARSAKLTAIDSLDLGVITPIAITVHTRYIVMTRVPGAPIDLEILREGANHHLIADNLVAFLKALASVDPIKLSRLGIAPSYSDRWSTFAHDVQRNLFPMMTDSGRARAHGELQAVCALPHVAHTLVHGDLGGGNMHWVDQDKEPRLAAVLDWDEAHIGDSAEDLASLQATVGHSIIQIVINRLELDEAIHDRVDAIQGTFALQQALFAFRDKDAVELVDGLRDYQ